MEQNNPNVRWEYTSIYMSKYEKFKMEANQLGLEGWEAVTFGYIGPSAGALPILIFKRRLP
jgi:hypothetical protein